MSADGGTGMGLERRLDAVIDRAIGSGRIVGAVVVVARDGNPVYRRAAGLADREANRAMTEDAIFRLASVSKPIVASTVLALVDRGTLALDVPITEWLPDFRPTLPDGTATAITLRHLLSHTSGITYGDHLPDSPYAQAGVSGGLAEPGRTMADNLRRLGTVPLQFAPGTAWRYGYGIDVAGGVVETATGVRLGETVAALVTGPLGMRDTAFTVTDAARLATPYAEGVPPNAMGAACEIRGELGRGTTFEPARIFNTASFHSGGAGMAGTAPDLLRLLEAFRTNGGGVISAATMAEAVRNQIGDLPREDKDAGWRFGLLSALLADPSAARMPMAAGTLEWGGIYGHGWAMDRTNGLSIVSFTNSAVEGCLGDFPKDVRRAVYG